MKITEIEDKLFQLSQADKRHRALVLKTLDGLIKEYVAYFVTDELYLNKEIVCCAQNQLIKVNTLRFAYREDYFDIYVSENKNSEYLITQTSLNLIEIGYIIAQRIIDKSHQIEKELC